MLTRLPAVIVVLLAAGLAAAGSPQQPSPSLKTVFDSTGDTIVARVSGVVPHAALPRLVSEMRIAPAVDDTTLFTDIGEFDVDRRGFIWAYDRPSRSMFLFDAAGRLVRRIGRSGAGPGEFNDNGGMVVLGDGRLAQWDPANARISFFSPAGEFMTSWPVRGGFGSNNNLFTDVLGQLYTKRPVPEPGSRGGRGSPGGPGALVRYKNGGAFGDTLRPPTFSVSTILYSANKVSRGMVIAAPFSPHSLWEWHPDGHFIAGDGGRYHILIARNAQKPIRIERAAPPVSIGGDERRQIELAMTAGMRLTDPSWQWTGPALPRTKAPLADLFIDRRGRIWAQVAVPSVRLSADVVGSPPERYPYESPQVWEVYTPTGIFLGRVPFPRDAQLVEADDDRVWVLDRDDDDLQAIVRLRIVPGLPKR